jgi:hypothetical protein
MTHGARRVRQRRFRAAISAQRLRPVAADRADPEGAGIEPGAVDRDRSQPGQPAPARRRRHPREGRLEGGAAGAAGGGNGVVVGVRIGRDGANADVAARRPLDAPRGEDRPRRRSTATAAAWIGAP